MSLNILLIGCNGSMGKVISEEVYSSFNFEIVAGVDNTAESSNYSVYKSIKEIKEKPDVIIDFSSPNSLDDILSYGLKEKVPMVLATTGYSDDQVKKINETSNIIPIFRTANMSYGVNILIKILKDITPLLKEFDIEIIEKHHNKKVDAPSGTAKMLKDTILDSMKEEYNIVYGRQGNDSKRETNEIGVHAVRGGTISGEHSVIFAGDDEIIEIKHQAQSKKLFAKGALKAAAYIIKKEKGLYNMTNLIEEIGRE